MDLTHHGRYDYSALIERPDFCWPDGKRLAFYLALNVEHFAFGGAMGHTPTSLGPPPGRSEQVHHLVPTDEVQPCQSQQTAPIVPTTRPRASSDRTGSSSGWGWSSTQGARAVAVRRSARTLI